MAQRTDVGKVETVTLSPLELEELARLAHFYERVMGPMRRVVIATASAEVKAKYRFVSDESRFLEQYMLHEMERARRAGETVVVEMQPRALVALWGRLLAAGHHKRTVRKLSSEQLELRGALSGKFREAAAALARRDPARWEMELATRRPREVAWMRDELGER